MFVKTRLKDDVLKIYLTIRKPKVSGSGKNLVIATTMGPAGTGSKYKGQDITVVANAYIRNVNTAEAKSKHSGRGQETLEDATHD
jgi:hypothetical protein